MGAAVFISKKARHKESVEWKSLGLTFVVVFLNVCFHPVKMLNRDEFVEWISVPHT